MCKVLTCLRQYILFTKMFTATDSQIPNNPTQKISQLSVIFIKRQALDTVVKTSCGTPISVSEYLGSRHSSFLLTCTVLRSSRQWLQQSDHATHTGDPGGVPGSELPTVPALALERRTKRWHIPPLSVCFSAFQINKSCLKIVFTKCQCF